MQPAGIDLPEKSPGEAASAKCPLTVLVATKNEEANIAACIRSVLWADEVIVVDSQSEDRTTEIASGLGAACVQFHYDGGWPKKRNWALRHLPLRNEWVLILDADERVTPELREEIEAAVRSGEYAGYYIRWKFYFLGRWMRHCWSHGWMLRLFRKDCGEYEDLEMRGEGGWDAEVHENVVVGGKVRRLRSYLVHDSEQSLSYWIKKQNEFSDWNAGRRLRQLREPIPPLSDLLSNDPFRRRKWLKAVFLRCPWKPLLLFVYLYFLRLGFLDGRAGLYFCSLRAAHELNINAKLYELRHR